MCDSTSFRMAASDGCGFSASRRRVADMRLGQFNTAPSELAVEELLRCCGSTRWAAEMAGARPFADIAAVLAAADQIWSGLAPADWLEAFAAHPRIGETARSDWSAQEQAGVHRAAGDLRARLAEG